MHTDDTPVNLNEHCIFGTEFTILMINMHCSFSVIVIQLYYTFTDLCVGKQVLSGTCDLS